MTSSKTHKYIPQIVSVSLIHFIIYMMVIPEIISNTQWLVRLYMIMTDSNIQTVYQAYHRTEIRDYLLKSSLVSQNGGYYL